MGFKRLVLIGVLLGAFVLPASAVANYWRPGVSKPTAERRVKSFLAKNFPGWRYRAHGIVDCDQGRINRFSWACRVGWYRGHTCHRGRARVIGVERRRRFNVYSVHFAWKRPYDCIGVG